MASASAFTSPEALRLSVSGERGPMRLQVALGGRHGARHQQEVDRVVVGYVLGQPVTSTRSRRHRSGGRRAAVDQGAAQLVAPQYDAVVGAMDRNVVSVWSAISHDTSGWCFSRLTVHSVPVT